MEGGDLVALEAKYHLKCYTSFHNSHRGLLRNIEQESGSSIEENEIKARALVELFSNIENCVEDSTFYFKFSLSR